MADRFLAGPRRRPGRSKHWVEAGDLAGLLALFWTIRDKVLARSGKILSDCRHSGSRARRVLDPPVSGEGRGSRATWWTRPRSRVSRRRRRAKTDKIDGEGLLRALLAFKRGEPRVCSMVRVPAPQGRGPGRSCRERKTLTAERIRRVIIGSKACCFLRGSAITSRCARIDAERWRRLARATSVRWART